MKKIVILLATVLLSVSAQAFALLESNKQQAIHVVWEKISSIIESSWMSSKIQSQYTSVFDILGTYKSMFEKSEHQWKLEIVHELMRYLKANQDVYSSVNETSFMFLSYWNVRKEVISEKLTIHTYFSLWYKDGWEVATHILEWKNKVLVIDTQMDIYGATEVKDYILSLNKVLDKIIVSHAHPDHGYGYAYMTDLWPAWGTKNTIEESNMSFPMFVNFLKWAPDAENMYPLDNVPKITKELELWTYDFDGNMIEFFEHPTHEVNDHQLFVLIKDAKVLITFDAIMPNSHQLIFWATKETAWDRVTTGQTFIKELQKDMRFDRMMYWHSIHPTGRETLQIAYDNLGNMNKVASESNNAGEFIAGMKAISPELADEYLWMTAGLMFPEAE